MFERFTDRARRAMVAGQIECGKLGHSELAAEHMLLGLLHEPEGVAGRVLADAGVTLTAAREALVRRGGQGEVPQPVDEEALATIGVDLMAIRTQIEDSFGEGALERTTAYRDSLKTPFTDHAKRALEKSLRTAIRWGHNYIGTEHLLVAIVDAGESVALDLLRDLGVPVDEVEERTLAVLAEINRGRQAEG